MTESELTRRDFVKAGAVTTASVLLSAKTASAETVRQGMPDRPLGRTGHRVKLFSLGGQATLEKPGMDDEAAAIVNRAIDLGVNYIDTAAAYGRGQSQKYIGQVMATRRDEVFLATKTHNWTYDGSMRLLDESLRSLQTDHLDLWQIHNLRTDEQLDTILGPTGAIRALERARRENMVRYLGVTGHFEPAVLMRAINRFEFDTVLLALNPADRHHLPFTRALLPLANEKGMGVIAMKIPARGRIFRAGGITSIKDPLTWVLSQPVSTVIIGCDNVQQLEENVSIATSFEPLSDREMRRIEGLTSSYAKEALFFRKDAAGFRGPDTDDQQTD